MRYGSIFQPRFIFIPRHRFDKSVKNLSGKRYRKHFTACRQFLTCRYAQITGKDSSQEIENGLLANHDCLYLPTWMLTNQIRDTRIQNFPQLEISAPDRKQDPYKAAGLKFAGTVQPFQQVAMPDFLQDRDVFRKTFAEIFFVRGGNKFRYEVFQHFPGPGVICLWMDRLDSV